MQLLNLRHTLTIIAAAFAATAIADTPTYHLPGAHTEMRNDLLASQVNVGSRINNEDTRSFIDNIFAEEEEPEADIYEDNWNSRLVNPYSAEDVPYSQVIDVSNFCMPHPGYLTSPYGYRKRFRRMHKGVDIKLYVGDTVRAAFDGRVRLTNFERKGYGNYVILRHTNQLETVYGHLSRFLVSDGDYVKAGDPIALGGNTGRSTGPHLHFETRFFGYAINPAAIFDFANQTVHTDTYTFTKDTYQDARNFDPEANSQYAIQFNNTHPRPAAPSVSNSGSRATGASTYRVKKGDTLSRIAARHGVTVRQLCRLNGLKTSSKLRTGQRIRLR